MFFMTSLTYSEKFKIPAKLWESRKRNLSANRRTISVLEKNRDEKATFTSLTSHLPNETNHIFWVISSSVFGCLKKIEQFVRLKKLTSVPASTGFCRIGLARRLDIPVYVLCLFRAADYWISSLIFSSLCFREQWHTFFEYILSDFRVNCAPASGRPGEMADSSTSGRTSLFITENVEKVKSVTNFKRAT